MPTQASRDQKELTIQTIQLLFRNWQIDTNQRESTKISFYGGGEIQIEKFSSVTGEFESVIKHFITPESLFNFLLNIKKKC